MKNVEIPDIKLNELRGEIKAQYGSERRFANVMAMTASQLSNKLNGKTKITYDDLIKFKHHLHLSDEEFSYIFF